MKNRTPYSTTEIDTKNFIDITSLYNEMGTNYSINENDEIMLIGDILVTHFKKETPFIAYYKRNFSENKYKTINIKRNTKRKQIYPNKKYIFLKSAYKHFTFKEYFHSLCNSNLIPEQFQYFYEQLLTNNTINLIPLQNI